jgi:hypothetical protein
MPDPRENHREQEFIVERIANCPEVRILFLASLPHVLITMRPKHRDPLDLLSEYIAKVSATNAFSIVTTLILL